MLREGQRLVAVKPNELVRRQAIEVESIRSFKEAANDAVRQQAADRWWWGLRATLWSAVRARAWIWVACLNAALPRRHVGTGLARATTCLRGNAALRHATPVSAHPARDAEKPLRGNEKRQWIAHSKFASPC